MILIKDKNDALHIDMKQLDLSEASANISHKPDATRIPKGSVFIFVLSFLFQIFVRFSICMVSHEILSMVLKNV